MGSICLYVLMQKSGQKTAKSHLCAVWENYASFTFQLVDDLNQITIAD